jgi:hypothetical protein
MALYLALSCLQGRPLRAAATDLLGLGPDGLQLTPGNVPSEGDAEWLAAQGALLRTHHGFSYDALRRAVWSADLALRVDASSVHPPSGDVPAERLPRDAALEVMYPGHALGTGEAVERAMTIGLRLAVDVSHVFLQLSAGAMGAATWRRLREYDLVDEVHVSDNDGRRDSHRPIDARSFGLAWAVERARAGVPAILECYMHRLSRDERRRQVDALRRALG